VGQDPLRPTCAVGAQTDWDGRRILSTGLVILVMIAWLAASALLFWILIAWD
jgi:hypothetical protein